MRHDPICQSEHCDMCMMTKEIWQLRTQLAESRTLNSRIIDVNREEIELRGTAIEAMGNLLSAMDDWHHWPDSVSTEPLWKRYHEARSALAKLKGELPSTGALEKTK